MSSNSILSSTSPLTRGAMIGVGAFLLGYAVTFLGKGSTIMQALQRTTVSVPGGETRQLSQLFTETTVPAWKGAGWLFYNAHFVTVRTKVPLINEITRVNIIQSAGGEYLLLLLVPPVLLVFAGWFNARIGQTEDTGVISRGVMIIAGYLPMVIIGTFLFTVSVSDAAFAPPMAPVTINAIIIAGVLYPLVFGAIGGWILGWTSM